MNQLLGKGTGACPRSSSLDRQPEQLMHWVGPTCAFTTNSLNPDGRSRRMAGNDSPEALIEADLAAERDLDRQLTEAMRRKDPEATMACFQDHPDLVLAVNGAVLRGPVAVRSAMQAMLAQSESISLEVNQVTHLLSGTAV